MKHILKPAWKFILIGIFFIVNYSNGQSLKMKFYNKTGFDLDSLVVNETFIGRLTKDSATDYINFDFLIFDTGSPDANLVALINNKNIATPKIRLCGTEMKKVSEGSYLSDIVIGKWGNEETIVLSSHR